MAISSRARKNINEPIIFTKRRWCEIMWETHPNELPSDVLWYRCTERHRCLGYQAPRAGQKKVAGLPSGTQIELQFWFGLYYRENNRFERTRVTTDTHTQDPLPTTAQQSCGWRRHAATQENNGEHRSHPTSQSEWKGKPDGTWDEPSASVCCSSWDSTSR